jgi:hypothetical protein
MRPGSSSAANTLSSVRYPGVPHAPFSPLPLPVDSVKLKLTDETQKEKFGARKGWSSPFVWKQVQQSSLPRTLPPRPAIHTRTLLANTGEHWRTLASTN